MFGLVSHTRQQSACPFRCTINFRRCAVLQTTNTPFQSSAIFHTEQTGSLLLLRTINSDIFVGVLYSSMLNVRVGVHRQN